MLSSIALVAFFCVQQVIAADVGTVALVEWMELWMIDKAGRGVHHAAVFGSLEDQSHHNSRYPIQNRFRKAGRDAAF